MYLTVRCLPGHHVTWIIFTESIVDPAASYTAAIGAGTPVETRALVPGRWGSTTRSTVRLAVILPR